MRIKLERLLICALFLTVLCFNVYGNKTSGIVTSPHIIKFQLIDGLIIIRASVNGVEGNYIYDTGSSHVILNQKCAEADQLLSAVGRELKAKAVDFIALNLGGRRIESQRALVSDLTFVELMINVPLAGLIGTDLLEQQSVMIDFNLGEISFFERNQSPSFKSSSADAFVSLPYEIVEENLVVVEIEFGGVKRKLAFDTGATHSVIHSEKPENQITSESTHVKMKNVRVAQLPYRHLDLSNFDAIANKSIEGILAAQSLNANRIIIDRERQRIHLFWAQKS